MKLKAAREHSDKMLACTVTTDRPAFTLSTNRPLHVRGKHEHTEMEGVVNLQTNLRSRNTNHHCTKSKYTIADVTASDEVSEMMHFVWCV